MNKTPVLTTTDTTAASPTSRMCRLDLRAVPTARRPAKRGFGRSALLRLGVTIVALELVIAGGLRLGVGAPQERPAAAPVAEVTQIAPRASALPLSALDVPPAHPAVVRQIREDAARIADAAPTVHLQGGPTGFGTF
ncbi:MAG: hypothetical protein CVU56_17785 [Deltaproteobacteria bacterium HGW-Deltaproteobacteria-14]|nr:MAG: hypothetical protein CVU56_17785 [Deltaproteobacteria bacterium HGW-Deltaproteobacteria-14]